MKRVIAFVFIVASFCLYHAPAEAAVAKELTYNKSIVWRCAVRFLRVDSGYTILEKDKDSGYLLFEFTEGTRKHNGSFEIMEVTRSNRKFVRVQINVFGQPKYVESLMFNKLNKKLKKEYGFPPSAEYVSPPVDLTGGGNNASANSTKSVDDDAAESDLEVNEEDFESQED